MHAHMESPSLPRRIVLALVAGLLGACAMTPAPLPEPAPPPASRWQATLPHQGSPGELALWWARLNDPVLPLLIAQAQTAHPAIAQALARLRQARAAQRSTRAEAGPRLDGSAQLGRASNSGTSFIALTQASVGADATWEVDLFGAVRQRQTAARARADQAEYGWHEARVSLAADLAGVYVELRHGEQLLRLLEQESQSLGTLEDLTRRRAEVGFESPANARLAAASAAQARERVTAQRALNDLSIKTLVLLTTLPETDLRQRLAERHAELPGATPFGLPVLPAAVLAQRPDIAAAESELQASAAEVGVAEAARWPRLTINGSLGLGLVRLGGDTSDAMTWGFGPTLTLPLLDGGRGVAQVDAARARYDEARAGYELRLRTAVREVEQALVRITARQAREADSRLAAEGLRAFHATTLERMRLGAANLIEVEEARRQALSAEAAVLGLQREELDAWIALYRAAGGGWNASPPNSASR